MSARTFQIARKTRRLAGVIGLGLLAGCASFNDPGMNPALLEQYTAAQIFERGEYELERGQPDRAATFFGEIERLYPYSDFAKRALIMQAFAYQKDRDYPNSRAAAQRYIDFYPASEDAAYASYLLALSYYDQIDEIGRDQGLTFQALQALRQVIEQYPDTEYARSSILKFDLAIDHLAANGNRQVLSQAQALCCRRKPVPRCCRRFPDDVADRRGALPSGGILSGAWLDPRGADCRCDTWSELPVHALVSGRL